MSSDEGNGSNCYSSQPMFSLCPLFLLHCTFTPRQEMEDGLGRGRLPPGQIATDLRFVSRVLELLVHNNSSTVEVLCSKPF